MRLELSLRCKDLIIFAALHLSVCLSPSCVVHRPIRLFMMSLQSISCSVLCLLLQPRGARSCLEVPRASSSQPRIILFHICCYCCCWASFMRHTPHARTHLLRAFFGFIHKTAAICIHKFFTAKNIYDICLLYMQRRVFSQARSQGPKISYRAPNE